MEEKMIFVGIDGGVQGGIVVLDKNQKIIEKLVMPVIKTDGKTIYDVKGIVNFFEPLHSTPYGSVFVCLEKAYTRPVQGIRSAFNTGYGYGVIQGVLESFGISYETINPQTWMKEFEINSKNEKGSILFCQRKWADEKWTATDRSKKPHDGLCDAAVISLFCYRKNMGRNI